MLLTLYCYYCICSFLFLIAYVGLIPLVISSDVLVWLIYNLLILFITVHHFSSNYMAVTVSPHIFHLFLDDYSEFTVKDPGVLKNLALTSCIFVNAFLVASIFIVYRLPSNYMCLPSCYSRYKYSFLLHWLQIVSKKTFLLLTPMLFF